MTLTFDEFFQQRPYLYHLTACSNIPAIESVGELKSSAELLEEAGKERMLRTKRKRSEQLVVGGFAVSLRDQAPLYAGNIQLRHGWTFSDVVEMLNEHVYFWPGDSGSPSRYGVRHYCRYEKEGEELTMLRVAATDLLSANPESHPRFCRYNSGSPRCSGGQRSPRGDDTFQAEADFAGTPSDVVEVVFHRRVRLPPAILYGHLVEGRWQGRSLAQSSNGS
jgi:hypothetical protein